MEKCCEGNIEADVRIFDSQKKTTWVDEKGRPKSSLRLGPKKSILAKIGSAVVSSVKIVGKKASGDGVICLSIKNSRRALVFSKSFKFTKNASTEVSFDCNIEGVGLEIFLSKPSSSSGSVIVERVLMEGSLYGPSIETKKKKKNNSRPIDYFEATRNLTRRKNLAIIIPYGIYGGGEVYIKNLVSRGHKDYNIDILFTAKNNLMEELEGCSAKIVKLGGPSGLRSRLYSDRYDAVVFYNSKKVHDILEEGRLQGGFSADIVEIYHSDFLWPDAISRIRSRRCVDKLFRVSSGLAQDITGIDERRKICIPVGVDPERFKEKPEIGFPSDVDETYQRNIGMVARLSPEKNIDYAMSIMKELPDYQLVIVGSGPLRQKLEDRKKDEGISNVTFVGYKSFVEQYYNIFDALLLTSKIEGTPISIIEALMCGLPIFSTPVGQIESDYSGLHGVNMLTGNVKVDAKALSSFDYDNFKGDDLRSFAVKNHGLDYVRDLFFSNILNSLSAPSPLPDETYVLPGEYI